MTLLKPPRRPERGRVWCPQCYGHGHVRERTPEGFRTLACTRCDGTGQIPARPLVRPLIPQLLAELQERLAEAVSKTTDDRPF